MYDTAPQLEFDPRADFFGLDDDLCEEVIAIRDKVRHFAVTKVQPIINDYWQREEFPREILPDLAGLGVVGTTIKGFGCPGLPRMASGIISRELARVDGSVTTFLGVHSNLAMGSINTFGNDEQRQRWLPDMAQLKKIGAFALTEPTHGSDAVGLETSARQEGDTWTINGEKRWVGNGEAGDIVIVFARNEMDGEVHAFVVEKQEDGNYPPGYEPTVIKGKIGKRAVLQADVVLNNMKVPESNRLAGCTAFGDINQVLKVTRGGAAWESVGHAMAAFEIAANYASQRKQFGNSIASYQMVQQKLANMLGELVSMQLMCIRLSTLANAGKLTNAQASLTKMATSQKGKWICNEAREILAGNGLLLDYHIGRHLTDMEVVSTYEGTDSIQALIVGREITGVSAFR